MLSTISVLSQPRAGSCSQRCAGSWKLEEEQGDKKRGWKTPGLPELLVVYTCPKVGLVEQRTRTTMHSLRLGAEGAAMTGGHGESGYWGLLASAPFFRCLPRFHSLCESDGS